MTDETGDEPAVAGDRRPAAPPTHLLARSVVAGVAVVLGVVTVVVALRNELPAELLELVADYFDWLFNVVG